MHFKDGKKDKRKERNKRNTWKTANKMVDFNTIMSVIVFYVNYLNPSIIDSCQIGKRKLSPNTY